MNTRNAELYWKELQLLRLAAACRKIAQTSVEDEKTRLLSLALLRTQEREISARFKLITRRLSDDTKLLQLRFTSLR